jgi:S1/P1 Nuclease
LHYEDFVRTLLRIIAVFVVLNSICWGWGPEGHQVVATVAEDRLDETTKVIIQSLLGNNHRCSIASWADAVRNSSRETGPWHYVNIPLGSTYSATRDCALLQSCVVLKIDEFAKVRTDKQASRQDRAEALNFIVHFVGDIHQPMHAVKR